MLEELRSSDLPILRGRFESNLFPKRDMEDKVESREKVFRVRMSKPRVTDARLQWGEEASISFAYRGVADCASRVADRRREIFPV